jgi:hypothetical protein
MKLHANARSCPNSRRLLVRRIEEDGWALTPAAEAAGVSERSARKWLSRWRSEGEAEDRLQRESRLRLFGHRTLGRRVRDRVRRAERWDIPEPVVATGPYDGRRLDARPEGRGVPRPDRLPQGRSPRWWARVRDLGSLRRMRPTDIGRSGLGRSAVAPAEISCLRNAIYRASRIAGARADIPILPCRSRGRPPASRRSRLFRFSPRAARRGRTRPHRSWLASGPGRSRARARRASRGC